MAQLDIRLAQESRNLPVYVCFSDPGSPVMYTMKETHACRWVTHCAAHQILGCGWFRLRPTRFQMRK